MRWPWWEESLTSLWKMWAKGGWGKENNCAGNKSVCRYVSMQVRSISLNVRKNVSLNTLSQDVLLKEFSTISWEHTASRCLQSRHCTVKPSSVTLRTRNRLLLHLWTRKTLPANTQTLMLTGRMHLKVKHLRTLQTSSSCGCLYACDNSEEVWVCMCLCVLHWFQSAVLAGLLTDSWKSGLNHVWFFFLFFFK